MPREYPQAGVWNFTDPQVNQQTDSLIMRGTIPNPQRTLADGQFVTAVIQERRQEMKLVTSDDASTLIPPNIPDEAAHVIAEEVKSLTFSYFDGSQWQDTWDSTQPGADGATPKGPPLAIAIVIGIPAPGAERTNNGNLKQYRHVVAIPSANGATQPNTTYYLQVWGQRTPAGGDSGPGLAPPW